MDEETDNDEKPVPWAGLTMVALMLEGSGRCAPQPEEWAKMTPDERRHELEKAAEFCNTASEEKS